jgi:formylglycine-generating enzyme required for sulfatase activity
VVIGIILLLIVCLLLFFCESKTGQGLLYSVFDRLPAEWNTRQASSGTTVLFSESFHEQSNFDIIDPFISSIDTDIDADQMIDNIEIESISQISSTDLVAGISQSTDVSQTTGVLGNTGLITNDENIEIADISNYQQLDDTRETQSQITQNESSTNVEIVQQATTVQRLPPAPVPSNMTYIRGGTYYMGSPLTEEERGEDEELHLVTIQAFYIGMYEVTQREYEEVMGVNPSYFKGPNLPVENVSWFNAVEYCNRISIRDRLTPAYTITGTGTGRFVTWDESANGYRLPTEAEWEYACRAGTTTPFNTGTSLSRNMANTWGNRTRNVGSYPPNRWGLHDMHGNVAEWCWDAYGDNSSTIQQGRFSETTRVFRGGNWVNTAMRARSAFRDHFYPTLLHPAVGFRVVRNVE